MKNNEENKIINKTIDSIDFKKDKNEKHLAKKPEEIYLPDEENIKTANQLKNNVVGNKENRINDLKKDDYIKDVVKTKTEHKDKPEFANSVIKDAPPLQSDISIKKQIAPSVTDIKQQLAEPFVEQTLDDIVNSTKHRKSIDILTRSDALINAQESVDNISKYFTGIHPNTTGDIKMSRPDFMGSRKIGTPKFVGQNPYLNSFNGTILQNMFRSSDIDGRVPNRGILSKEQFDSHVGLTKQFTTYDAYKEYMSVTNGYGHMKVSIEAGKNSSDLNREILNHLNIVTSTKDLKKGLTTDLNNIRGSVRFIKEEITAKNLTTGSFDSDIVSRNQRKFIIDTYGDVFGQKPDELSSLNTIEDQLIDELNDRVIGTMNYIDENLNAIETDATFKTIRDAKDIDDAFIKSESFLNSVREQKSRLSKIGTKIEEYERGVIVPLNRNSSGAISGTLKETLLKQAMAEVKRLEETRAVILNQQTLKDTNPDHAEKIQKRQQTSIEHIDEAIQEAKNKYETLELEIDREFGYTGRKVSPLENNITVMESNLSEIELLRNEYVKNPSKHNRHKLIKSIKKYNANSNLSSDLTRLYEKRAKLSYSKTDEFLTMRHNVSVDMPSFFRDKLNNAKSPDELLELSKEMKRFSIIDLETEDGKKIVKSLPLTEKQAKLAFVDIEYATKELADQIEELAILQRQELFAKEALGSASKFKKFRKTIRIQQRRHQYKTLIRNKTAARVHRVLHKTKTQKIKESQEIKSIHDNIEELAKKTENQTGAAASIKNATESSLSELSKNEAEYIKSGMDQLRIRTTASRFKAYDDMNSFDKFADRLVTVKELRDHYKMKDGLSIPRGQYTSTEYLKIFNNQLFNTDTNNQGLIRKLHQIRSNNISLIEAGQVPKSTVYDQLDDRYKTLMKIYLNKSSRNTSTLFDFISEQSYRPGLFRSFRYIFSKKQREMVADNLAEAYSAHVTTKLSLAGDDFAQGIFASEFEDAVTKHGVLAGSITRETIVDAAEQAAEENTKAIIKSDIKTITSLDGYKKALSKMAGDGNLNDIDRRVRRLVFARNRLLSINTSASDEALSAITNALGAFTSGDRVAFDTAYEVSNRAINLVKNKRSFTGQLRKTTLRNTYLNHLGKVSQWTVGPVMTVAGIAGAALGTLSLLSSISQAAGQKLADVRKFDFGSGAALTNKSIATERQYSEQRIRETRHGSRNYLGREAQLVYY